MTGTMAAYIQSISTVNMRQIEEEEVNGPGEDF